MTLFSNVASESTLSTSSRLRARFWRRLATTKAPLHPPHTRPALQQWRFTRSGMPITLFEAKAWHPDRVSHDERVAHTAYHMEHYIRRMPSKGHGSRRVQRVCIVMDMAGFRPTTLPQVKECIDVLRNHYPARLGVATFINVPGYFHPVSKLISPLLDEEVDCPAPTHANPRPPASGVRSPAHAGARRSSRRHSFCRPISTTSRRRFLTRKPLPNPSVQMQLLRH